MIDSHHQYLNAQTRERSFARLVEDLEKGFDPVPSQDDPTARQAKIDATSLALSNLREQIRQWENEPQEPSDPMQAERS